MPRVNHFVGDRNARRSASGGGAPACVALHTARTLGLSATPTETSTVLLGVGLLGVGLLGVGRIRILGWT